MEGKVRLALAQHRNTTTTRTRSRFGIPVLAAGIGAVILASGMIPAMSAGAQPDATLVAAAPRALPDVVLATETDRQQAASRSGDNRSLKVAPDADSTESADGTSTAPRSGKKKAIGSTTAPSTTPATPKTPAEAQAAWAAAAHEAEAMNEKVLLAEGKVTSTKAAAAAARTSVAAAGKKATAAEAKVATAQQAVDAYQAKLDEFAAASFRGARLSQFSSLLTAQSAEDFLDQASSLDQLAVDTQHNMAGLQDAKAVAVSAREDAAAAQTQARKAATAADEAVADATTAVTDLEQHRAELKSRITEYRGLMDTLTVSERADAIAAYEDANLTPDVRARHAAQAAVRAEAGISETDQDLLKTLDVAHKAPDTAAAIAVAAALSAEGLPYVWGAVGPDTFDCSGLMMWAWAKAGINIPRTSSEQYGLPEVPLDQLQPGDLVTYYSPVTHVGMYIGAGLVIHASTEGVPIKVADLYKAGPNPTGHRVPR
ncbi:NlpC/P60 family protein [Nakamurella silvestris]|nr:NlpC/P60 family protein [Nakamurella silvestris]